MNKIFTSLLGLILFSCGTTATKLSTKNNYPLVKTWTISNNNYSTKINYTYDQKGRLIEENGQTFEKSKNKQWLETTRKDNKPTTYTNYKDSILVDVNNTWNRFILDKNGLFIRDEHPNNFSKTRALTSRLKYMHNEEGYLIKQILFDDYVKYSYSTTYLYEYNNGNMVKETRNNRNIGEDGFVREDSQYTIYEYHKDLPNTIGNTQFGKSYLGRSNENLIKKARGSNGYSATYKYDFDTQGNIIRLRHINDENGMLTRDYRYEYY